MPRKTDRRTPDTAPNEIRRRANLRAAQLGFNTLRSCLNARLGDTLAPDLAMAAVDRGLSRVKSRSAVSAALDVPIDYWDVEEDVMWALLAAAARGARERPASETAAA